MIAKFLKISYILFVIAFAYGCFEEDSAIDPIHIDGIRISKSIYNYQSFYDFSSDSVFTNANGIWDLAFEASKEGWRVRINYSNLQAVYRTESSDFTTVDYSIVDSRWLYDASSGNPDSTAIGHWQVTTGEEPMVYLLGTYDGVRYKPTKKFRILDVTDTSYRFEFANMDNSGRNEATVKKDLRYNFVYYSFNSRNIVIVEPPKDRWDILFTQYTTTLYTNQGVPTPYIVRGTYLNPNKVLALLDTLTGYSNITAQNINVAAMSNVQDYIGYNWKAVEINQSANTARYAVRKNYSYVIRDPKGDYYKLHFLTYVNDSLLVGYPLFEKEKL
jgi:hypothetical protein